MAVYFPTNQDFGPFAFDSTGATPTKMYWYIERFGCLVGKEKLFGAANKSGTLTDGPLLTNLKTRTQNPDLSTGALEFDTDADSPYKGDIRIAYTCV